MWRATDTTLGDKEQLPILKVNEEDAEAVIFSAGRTEPAEGHCELGSGATGYLKAYHGAVLRGALCRPHF